MLATVLAAAQMLHTRSLSQPITFPSSQLWAWELWRGRWCLDGMASAEIELVCKRAATKTRHELRRGLAGLRAIATTAPLIGIFGYALGIVNSFKGVNGEKSTIMAAIAAGLGEAGVPAAFGILVAIAAHVQLRTWESEVERLDTEMRCATLALLNELTVYDQGL